MPFVVYNDDNSIHTIAPFADDVLEANQTRVEIAAEDVPADHPNNYTYDGVTFTRKLQADIDAATQLADDDQTASSLIEQAKTDLAVTEALTDATLSQGVQDALNARMSEA